MRPAFGRLLAELRHEPRAQIQPAETGITSSLRSRADDRGTVETSPSRTSAHLAGACFGGLLLALAFPPVGAWPLGFVALTPLLWSLRTASRLRALLVGMAFGTTAFGVILYWILRFGETAWVALVVLSALFVVAFALLVRRVLRVRSPALRVLGVAAAWTVVEYARGSWPLGGFTWGSLGISQVDDPLLLPLASVGGVWGVTFVAVAVNALVLDAVMDRVRRRRRVGRVAVAVALILAPVAIPASTAGGPRLEVATLQVDIREAIGETTAEEDIQAARLHLDLHRELAQRPPDLIVWGESALDPGAASDPTTRDAVRRVVADVGTPTLVGAVPTDDTGQRTSVLLFDEEGHVVDQYDKTHLVPFGEYVPWRGWLSWFEALRQIPVDRVPGQDIAPVRLAGLPSIGAPICFENAFPSLVREMVTEGAELLVVPVNNSSYGYSAASEQHLQMTRMRAVETGRWVVNAGISGISAIVDPSGRVVARTSLFETAILRGAVRASSSRTPFVRFGDWVVWSSGLLLALMLATTAGRSIRIWVFG